MPRKKQDINPKQGVNLKKLLETKKSEIKARTGRASHAAFCDLLHDHYHIREETLSRIINGKCGMDYALACAIKELFSEVRIEYLMGQDDFMTEEEYFIIRSDVYADIYHSALILLNYGFTEAGLRDPKVKPPDNKADLDFLIYQLKDYAASLVWNYAHREHSEVWTYLDNINTTPHQKGQE